MSRTHSSSSTAFLAKSTAFGEFAMPQFDAFENPNAAQRLAFPYFVVMQSDQLDHFNTCLTMPLTRSQTAGTHPPRRLAQTVLVKGEALHMAPHLMAALPKAALKRRVVSLRAHAALFIDALDAVVSGV
jgi:toxin CcdB